MIINNKQDFENFYPYDKKYIDEYPKEYPCICKFEYEGGGLMGEYKQVYVAYFPKNKNINLNESFIEGLYYIWKPLK